MAKNVEQKRPEITVQRIVEPGNVETYKLTKKDGESIVVPEYLFVVLDFILELS